MRNTIQDPEESEKLLLDAGFCVGIRDTKFAVRLDNRKISRAEVASVLGCETEDFLSSREGVLVA